MSLRPFDIVQRLYNAVDTAETAWMEYKAGCIPEFDAALGLHSGALQASHQKIVDREKQGWEVLGLILGATLGPWAPKLLRPVKSGVDDLTAEWVQAALLRPEINKSMQTGVDSLKDAIKGTALEKMKDFALSSAVRSFEPVVEKTMIWGARMEEGIMGRSRQLKEAILEVQNANKISLSAASQMEQTFKMHCPFLVDKPKKMSDADKARFRQDAELEMWAGWARQRDYKWWSNNAGHRDPWDMYPIMDRMFALGVNEVADYHPGRRSATIGGTWIRPGYVLNMVKLIEWANRRWMNANSCQKPVRHPLQLQQPAHPAQCSA